MGADLICTEPLVIDDAKQPDWDAAEEFVKSMSVQKIEAVFAEYAIDIDEDDPREMALHYLRECRDAYENEWRNTCHMRIRNARVWFIGETSWGDSPEGWDAVQITSALGAAEAAGFDA